MDGPVTGPCRLLALDIDGTLLGSDKRISRRTLEAVACARDKGVRIVLVTGRRHPAARVVAAQLGPGVPLVLHHGALVVEPDPAAGPDAVPRILRCLPLGREATLAAIALGRDCGADPVVHCGLKGEGRLAVAGIAADNAMLVSYVDRSGGDRVRLSDLERDLPADSLQVMFAGRLGAMRDLFPRLVDRLRGEAKVERTFYPVLDMGFVDVLHPEVGKAEAVAFLQQRWGVARAETVAIGDNWNDKEMLVRAGRGLVMGNADPELHALGLEVLPTNDQDGVAVAIERYVLANGETGKRAPNSLRRVREGGSAKRVGGRIHLAWRAPLKKHKGVIAHPPRSDDLCDSTSSSWSSEPPSWSPSSSACFKTPFLTAPG